MLKNRITLSVPADHLKVASAGIHSIYLLRNLEVFDRRSEPFGVSQHPASRRSRRGDGSTSARSALFSPMQPPPLRVGARRSSWRVSFLARRPLSP